MKLKEFLCVCLIILVGFLLFGFLNSGNKYALVGMNVALIVFYLLFLTSKLPDSFYNLDGMERRDRICIILGMLSFFTSIMFAFLPDGYCKPVARIGTYSLIIYWAVVGAYAAGEKLLNDMPLKEYKRYRWVYRRSVLFLFANWYLLLFICYSCNTKHDGVHIEKHVQDGGDTYDTKYNKKKRQYQTEVHLRDNTVPLGYIIYYKDYPDEIDHIDTLYVGEQEKQQ